MLVSVRSTSHLASTSNQNFSIGSNTDSLLVFSFLLSLIFFFVSRTKKVGSTDKIHVRFFNTTMKCEVQWLQVCLISFDSLMALLIDFE